MSAGFYLYTAFFSDKRYSPKGEPYSYHQTKNPQARHMRSKPSHSCHRIHAKLCAVKIRQNPPTHRQSRARKSLL